MTRSKRMRPLLTIATRKEEGAANVLVTSNNSLKEYKDKLEMMYQYRRDYASNSTSQSISANLLRDKQSFIRQIDQAIEMLEQQIEQQTIDNSRDKKSWCDAKQHSNALDKVVNKIFQTEQQIENEREQREIDDLVCKINKN